MAITGRKARDAYHYDADFTGESEVTELGTNGIRTPIQPVVKESAYLKVAEELLVTVKSITARENFKKIYEEDLDLLCDAVDRGIPSR